LLHRAYASLASRGMRFVASHQDEDRTRLRISGGKCFVAIHDGRMIGTITWRAPGRARGTPWYERPEVAVFGQFAVAPVHQGRGFGSQLLAVVEHETAAVGAVELALDTAEPAEELIRFYAKRGFRFIEYTRWDEVNYRSVVMSKRIQ